MRLFAFCLLICSITSTALATQAAHGGNDKHIVHTSPDAAAFRYQGRIDVAKPDSPVLIWQGSTVSFQTRAQSFLLGFDQLQGEVFFDLIIDGKPQLLEARNGWHTVNQPETNEVRRITLFKRTEAEAGTVAFLGVKTPAREQVLPTVESTTKTLKLLFYGDSITVGACNEDGETDQWETVRTHNTARSYGVLVANRLDAQYRAIAVSGMGIVAGYQPYTAEQIWDRLYPSPTAAIADVSGWQPDWVFVNFGENDDSFTRNKNMPFPQQFTQKYVALIRSMRRVYPEARIVILRGGMTGGAKSQRLIDPWWKAVKELEKGDNKIHHYVFEHWSKLHPRVADHQIMADELVRWLIPQLAVGPGQPSHNSSPVKNL